MGSAARELENVETMFKYAVYIYFFGHIYHMLWLHRELSMHVENYLSDRSICLPPAT